MRTRADASSLLLVLVVLAGCHVQNIDVDPPEPAPPPPKGSYGACGAARTVLAQLPGVLPVLSMDEFNLYTATAANDGSGAQSLWRVPKDGSAPVILATSPTPITGGVVISNPYSGYWNGVVWSSAGDPEAEGGPNGAVWAVGFDAGDEARVVVGSRLAPVGAVSIADQVYWAEQDFDPVGGAIESIMSVPLAGGAPTRIQSVPLFEAPNQLIVAAWGDPPIDGSPEFFSEGALFWTTAGPAASAEAIVCPISGADEPLVRYGGLDAGGAGGMAIPPVGAAVDVSLASSIGALLLGRDGGVTSPQTLIATTSPIEVFVNDGASLYFVQPGTSDLVAVPYFPPDAEAPRTLLTGVGPAVLFQVDAVCVYLLDTVTEALTMVAK